MGDGRSGGGDTQNNAQNLQVLPKKISLHFFLSTDRTDEFKVIPYITNSKCICPLLPAFVKYLL